MAVTGAWSERVAFQSGARKWGNGWHPIHAIRDEEMGDGPANTPRDYGGPWERGAELSTVPLVGEDLTHDYAYTDEDMSHSLWGYTHDDGTADHPQLGTPPTLARADVMQEFPAWGPYTNGVPGGTEVRAINKGAELTNTPKASPQHDPAIGGWRNKIRSFVLDSRTSDVSQLLVQTSEVQRDTERQGSQVPGDGRASEYKAPMRQHIPGMRAKVWGNPERHYDMTPKEQELIIRPWWGREAGTGDPKMMEPNATYKPEPLNREPPGAPYAGETTPQAGSSTTSETTDYGYVDEDVIPYA